MPFKRFRFVALAACCFAFALRSEAAAEPPEETRAPALRAPWEPEPGGRVLGQEPPDYATAKLKRLCGQSDEVHDYVHSAMSPDRFVSTTGSTGRQGETGRQLILFNDASWVLLFEFLDEASADDDVSCVVATGSRETAHQATRYVERELPGEAIGRPRERSLLERILKRPARRLEI